MSVWFSVNRNQCCQLLLLVHCSLRVVCEGVIRIMHLRMFYSSDVSLQLPDDVPMEIIDNKSADGSPPPLSDGRASPALDLGDISDPGARNDLNDFGDRLNSAHVLNDLDGHSEHDDLNELNDLNAVTPPSTHTNSPAPTPDHIDNSLGLPTEPLIPALTSQRVTTVDTTGDLPQEHSTPVVTSLRLKPSHLNGRDTPSSMYPPSTVTGGDHAAMASSDVSSSVAGQPVAPQPHIMAREPITAACSDRVGTNIKKIPTGQKNMETSVHEKPRSLEANNDNGEKERVGLAEEVTSPRPQIEAPDRRYHSRARLDSLEERNNLDTDSELQSFSESEKESDTEDYPERCTSHRRVKHSSAHQQSLSVSSSEDEDPFPEEQNDLSVVSSPEPELPPSDKLGGGFGVSLSGGVPTANLRDQHEDVSTNDLSACNASSSSLPLHQPMTGESADKLTFDQAQRKPGDGGLRLDLVPTSTEQGHDNTPACGEAGLQGGIQIVLGVNGAGPAGGISQGKPGQLESLLSGQERKRALDQDKAVENSSVGQSLSYLLTVPKSPDHHHSLQLVSQSEEEPLRTEPKVQVTRTSDQVIEPVSYSTSSSDQLHPPVGKSFSSLPTAYNISSLDGDYCLKVPDLEMPVSTSAPSTGLHMMLDQPPPPFTHYAAPPPIFTAHVFEQSTDHVFNSGSVEERDVQEDNNQSEGVGKDSGGGELSHSSAGMGMDYLTRQNQDISLSSLSVHPPLDERSIGFQSLLVNSLDNPPTVC